MTDQDRSEERRKLIADNIRPTMLIGLQDAELHGEPGTQRIGEWIDWIAGQLAPLWEEDHRMLQERLAAHEKTIASVMERNARLSAELNTLRGRSPEDAPPLEEK